MATLDPDQYDFLAYINVAGLIYQYVSIHQVKTANDHFVKIGKALSDKTRVLILKEILKRDSISCGDAMNIAALSQPTVSHHIKVLVDAGLLNAKKEGRHVIIPVNRKALDEFGRLISKSGTL